jgi:hypothetical protein
LFDLPNFFSTHSKLCNYINEEEGLGEFQNLTLSISYSSTPAVIIAQSEKLYTQDDMLYLSIRHICPSLTGKQTKEIYPACPVVINSGAV